MVGDVIIVNNFIFYYMNFVSVMFNSYEVKLVIFVLLKLLVLFKLSFIVVFYGMVMWWLISDYGMSLELYFGLF